MKKILSKIFTGVLIGVLAIGTISCIAAAQTAKTADLVPAPIIPVVTTVSTTCSAATTKLTSTTTTITTITELNEDAGETWEEDDYSDDYSSEDYYEEDYTDETEYYEDNSYINLPYKGASDRSISDYEYNLLVNLTSSEYGANWVSTDEKSKIAATVLNIADTYYDGSITDAIYNSCVPYGFDPSYDYYKDESIYNAVDNVVENEDAWSDWTATGWAGDGTTNYFY